MVTIPDGSTPYILNTNGVTATNSGVLNVGDSHQYSVAVNSSGDVISNFGSLEGGAGDGCLDILGNNDTIVNQSGGVVLPATSGAIYFSPTSTGGVITNYGSITDSSQRYPAIQMSDGGIVSNMASGRITGGGIYLLGASGTVTNAGYVSGNGSYGAINLANGGAVKNLSGGTISSGGASYGVSIAGGGTVTNAGTINGDGHAAVLMSSAVTNRVIEDVGGTFIGAVNGGTAADSTFELASGSGTGVVSGFGSSITNFGTLDFDAGSHWQVSATSSGIAATTIVGFNAGQTIDIAGFTATTPGTLGSASSFTIAGSGSTTSLKLKFSSSVEDLAVKNIAGGVELTTICFCPGTMIDTPAGAVSVESLTAGDVVMTAHNGPRKVSWVGKGKVLATRGHRSVATPVIVRKGALADNVPYKDLHVTKAHSLYIDDVFIPVEFLVNHRTILWDDHTQEVEIYHVELDSHDVLIANGAPAESYRDDGNRWLFHNANTGWGLPPQVPYAPVLTGGPVVDAAWKRLLERAGTRALPPLTDDPDLHLVADGRRIDVAERVGGNRVFRLNACPDRLYVASREGVPSELGLLRDARSLGVALRHIVARQGKRFAVIEANDPRLADGFHSYEAADDLRWTSGFAALPNEFLAQFREEGSLEIVLTLGGATMYPDFGDAVDRSAA